MLRKLITGLTVLTLAAFCSTIYAEGKPEGKGSKEAEKKKQAISFERVLSALNMLHSILETKKISVKEQRRCLKELMNEKNKAILDRSEFKDILDTSN